MKNTWRPSANAILLLRVFQIRAGSFIRCFYPIDVICKKIANFKEYTEIIDPDVLPAASYADLSVCYGLNSAGILAGLNGLGCQ